jgi:hypothetical protein
MDDLIILSKTRWQLKRAVAMMNRWFEQAKLKQHPDKTFIGRINKGFDWLGYQFDQHGHLSAAPRTLQHHLEKLRQLYEQASNKNASIETTLLRVAEYKTRWQRWLRSGFHPNDAATSFANIDLLYTKPCDVTTTASNPAT